jgi:uncharacterized membrane protein YbhN (UPF0104 family)
MGLEVTASVGAEVCYASSPGESVMHHATDDSPRGAPPQSLGRRALRLVLLSLAALLPLLWVARRTEPEQVLRSLTSVPPTTFALAALLQALSLLSVSVRSRALLAAVLAPGAATALPPVAFFVRTWLIGGYVGLLPVPGADDLVRLGRTTTTGASLTASGSVVLLERLLGLAGVSALALAGAWWSPAPLPDQAWYSAVVCVVLTAAGFVALAVGRPLIQKLPSSRLPAPLQRLLPQLPGPAVFGQLPLPFLASIASNFLSGLLMFTVIHAMAPDFTLEASAQVMPAMLLALAVPLTPGRVGQREFVFSLFLGGVGVKQGVVLASSLWLLAFGLLVALSGGLALLWERVVGQAEKP